jgi:tetrahydromethanopterin S-methyltransferase subunit F
LALSIALGFKLGVIVKVNLRGIAMGLLTDQMARLRRDIDDSRDSRLAQQNARVFSVSTQIADFAATRARNAAQDSRARASFVADNANDVNRLVSDFRHSRQLMGRQTGLARAAFVADMSQQTSNLLAGFHADRQSMAASTAKDRADFIANLTHDVSSFINAAAQDRAGAQAVFFGTAVSKKKTSFPA